MTFRHDRFEGCPATYLGDALYAVHRGAHLELRANDLHNPSDTVYLEPAVYGRLLQFMAEVAKNTEELDAKGPDDPASPR